MKCTLCRRPIRWCSDSAEISFSIICRPNGFGSHSFRWECAPNILISIIHKRASAHIHGIPALFKLHADFCCDCFWCATVRRWRWRCKCRTFHRFHFKSSHYYGIRSGTLTLTCNKHPLLAIYGTRCHRSPKTHFTVDTIRSLFGHQSIKFTLCTLLPIRMGCVHCRRARSLPRE